MARSNAARKRARVRKPKTLAAAIRKGHYRPILEEFLDERMAQRGARFLDWAAKQYPQVCVSLPLFLRAITGQRSTPSSKSKEVEAFRSSMSRVNKVLEREYGRALISLKDEGVRATVDDTDGARTKLYQRWRRFKSARDGLGITSGNINERAIRNQALRDWVKQIKRLHGQLSSPSFERKHLPPADRQKTEPPKSE